MRISKPSSNNNKTGFFNEEKPVYPPPPSLTMFHLVEYRVQIKKNISGCYPILSTKYKRHKWHFLFFSSSFRGMATKINLKKDTSFFINIKETFLDTLCLALLCTSLILGGLFSHFLPLGSISRWWVDLEEFLVDPTVIYSKTESREQGVTRSCLVSFSSCDSSPRLDVTKSVTLDNYSKQIKITRQPSYRLWRTQVARVIKEMNQILYERFNTTTHVRLSAVRRSGRI